MTDLNQRRALYHAAVTNQDATAVAALLGQGLSPEDTYRGRSIFDHAWKTPSSPEVLALLLGHRNVKVSMTWFWNTLADDQFTVQHVEAVFALVPYDVNDAFHRRHTARSLEASFGRQDQRLAEKIRFMCLKGWKPAEAWFDGKLPFHDYLEHDLIQAALACVEGGTDPHEPMRADGLGWPQDLPGWPEFEARRLAEQRQEQGARVVPMRCQRVRA